MFRKSPSDPQTAALQQRTQHGKALVNRAHKFGAWLVYSASAATLITLGADTLMRVWNGLLHGVVLIPQIVSLAVTGGLVLAMDTAMIQAATEIRYKRRRHESATMDVIILVACALMESGTFLSMLITYEHPSNIGEWALVIGRAVLVPVVSIYLTLSEARTATPSDIMDVVSEVSGEAVVRDFVRSAANADATPAQNLRVFAASSKLSKDDRIALAALLDTMGDGDDSHTPARVTVTEVPNTRQQLIALNRERRMRAVAVLLSESPSLTAGQICAALRYRGDKHVTLATIESMMAQVRQMQRRAVR